MEWTDKVLKACGIERTEENRDTVEKAIRLESDSIGAKIVLAHYKDGHDMDLIAEYNGCTALEIMTLEVTFLKKITEMVMKDGGHLEFAANTQRDAACAILKEIGIEEPSEIQIRHLMTAMCGHAFLDKAEATVTDKCYRLKIPVEKIADYTNTQPEDVNQIRVLAIEKIFSFLKRNTTVTQTA